MDTQMPELVNSDKKPGNFAKIMLLALIVLGFITAFAGGYFLKDLFNKESRVEQNTKSSPSTKMVSTSQTPLIPNQDTEIPETGQYAPGKQYFEDTVIAVTKDKPYYTIVATVTRLEQNNNFAQRGRVSFFDGKNWDRKSEEKNTADPAISGNKLITRWVTDIDPSRVLKESSQGEINFGSSKIAFSTGPLQNEIGIRSLPSYTKFISIGKGTLSINNQPYPAYFLYTRIYSLDASQIQFYNQPFGLTTDWLAFWDEEGNFYHLDKTEVDNPTQIYQTHKLGVLENKNGSVSKTFELTVTRASSIPPNAYTIGLASPIGSTLNLKVLDSIDKAPNNSYKWYMSHVVGTVQRGEGGAVLKGIGLIEYIHN